MDKPKATIGPWFIPISYSDSHITFDFWYARQKVWSMRPITASISGSSPAFGVGYGTASGLS